MNAKVILNIDAWMVRISGSQKFRLTRVTKAKNIHFPVELRRIFANGGAIGLTSHLMKAEGLSLAAAWARVKYLFNDFPV